MFRASLEDMRKTQKSLVFPITVLIKLRSSIDFDQLIQRNLSKQNCSECLKPQPSCIKKSDVLSVFPTCDMLLARPFAVNIELSLLVQKHDLTNCIKFIDLVLALYSRILKIAAGCIWVDVITDRYFSNNLKKGTRGARDNEGTTFGGISDHDEIPSNLQKDFIRNSLNKDTLYQHLAEIFIHLHSSATQILVVTYKDANLKTQDVPNESINWYKCEEADARVIRHLISVSK